MCPLNLNIFQGESQTVAIDLPVSQLPVTSGTHCTSASPRTPMANAIETATIPYTADPSTLSTPHLRKGINIILP